MQQSQFLRRTTLACVVTLSFLAAAPVSGMGRHARSHARPSADVAAEFQALAMQQPWRCATQSDADVPPTQWRGGEIQCAWQGRLRMRSWSGPGGVRPGACVSAQAHWWTWSRAGHAAPAAAWRSAWASQSSIEDDGPEKRIFVLRLLASGQWAATEWRWSPSPRAATRRWQEGRWNLLAARARQLRAVAEPAQGPQEARMLRGVLESHLANRVSEMGKESWQWQAGGLCLQVDAVGLGQQIMQLPYALDDSRTEQRAAMQLQLARRYPHAVWLTDFSLVPVAARARGGAKFYALWTEQALLKGQLWIPTKNNGPLVRLRLTTALTVPAGTPPSSKAIIEAHQVVRGELTALAARWASAYE